LKIIGYHGTCLSAAQGILANGFRASGLKKMAGPGAYLWAGPGALRSKALLLAETWYVQQRDAGAYELEKDKRLAIVRYEAEVDVENLVDLEMMHHREQLAEMNRLANEKGSPYKDASALYVAYILKIRKTRGMSVPPKPPVYAVRLSLPPPVPYRNHPQKALGLTAGVDAYIVLEQSGGEVLAGNLSVVQL
jgi:hypothetical protein